MCRIRSILSRPDIWCSPVDLTMIGFMQLQYLIWGFCTGAKDVFFLKWKSMFLVHNVSCKVPIKCYFCIGIKKLKNDMITCIQYLKKKYPYILSVLPLYFTFLDTVSCLFKTYTSKLLRPITQFMYTSGIRQIFPHVEKFPLY